MSTISYRYGHVPRDIVQRAVWLQEFQAEVLQFPHGRHDDQVDSLSQFLAWISRPKPPEPRIRWL